MMAATANVIRTYWASLFRRGHHRYTSRSNEVACGYRFSLAFMSVGISAFSMLESDFEKSDLELLDGSSMAAEHAVECGGPCWWLVYSLVVTQYNAIDDLHFVIRQEY